MCRSLLYNTYLVLPCLHIALQLLSPSNTVSSYNCCTLCSLSKRTDLPSFGDGKALQSLFVQAWFIMQTCHIWYIFIYILVVTDLSCKHQIVPALCKRIWRQQHYSAAILNLYQQNLSFQGSNLHTSGWQSLGKFLKAYQRLAKSQ